MSGPREDPAADASPDGQALPTVDELVQAGDTDKLNRLVDYPAVRDGLKADFGAPMVEEALDLASRLAAAADAGRVDLGDLGRRARRLLAATTIRD